MKKKHLLILSGAATMLFLAYFLIGCSGISKGLNKVTDAITNPTARELYERELKDNKPVLDAWEAAYESAQQDSLTVSIPYGEKGTFKPNLNTAYSYTVTVQEGEVLVAEVYRDSINQRVFMDLFEKSGNNFRHIESNNDNGNILAYEPDKGGTYKLVIQPELAANSDFFISINKRPLYTTFPVKGKGNADIWSFWGMERDGGARKHEGIDIFAKRGTPVIAVTDGYITRTGDYGLGGKQVWLRDGSFGAALYYAHLDAIKAKDGDRVKAGDTLGFVGNTGNARSTAPHLHFGIYRGFGAVNPLPFVYTTDKISQKQYTRSYKAASLKVKGNANLRQGPSTTAPVVGTAIANEVVTLLGQSKDWLHIQTSLGKKAFISKSLVKA